MPTKHESVSVKVAENISLKGKFDNRISTNPTTIKISENFYACIFRYGIITFIGGDENEQLKYIASIKSKFIREMTIYKFSEKINIFAGNEDDDLVEDGEIQISEFSTVHIQLISEALSKSFALEDYEEKVSQLVEQIESKVDYISNTGKTPGKPKELLKLVGTVLKSEHSMIGRVAPDEKPEVLWNFSEYLPFYKQLDREFELSERTSSLKQKLELISHFGKTVIELIHNERSLRVEWLIVLLILAEIILNLF